MGPDDVAFLTKLNAHSKKSPTRASAQPTCSEDQFEEVMSVFEHQSSLRQPFAAVDNAPVLPYPEMEAVFDDTIDEQTRRFAKDIYEHWRSRRLKHLNNPLMPSLKFERNVETDDSDPYVCFRRREVRQVRKTRARDAQIAEKLKKLRSELELARQLMHLSKQRELYRRDQLVIDRQIFEQRAAVKEAKRNLGIKGDEDDLVHQKPVPKPKPKSEAPARAAPGLVARPPPQINGKVESDLRNLAEERAKRNAEIKAIIQESMVKHKTWNADWVDRTWRPITPPLEESWPKSSFRTAITDFIPTPPASTSSEHSQDDGDMVNQSFRAEDTGAGASRYASPSSNCRRIRPSYRRRTGRGGRMFIDRRGLQKWPRMSGDEIDDRLRERMEMDVDSDEEQSMYETDPYEYWNIRYRLLFVGMSQSQTQNQRQNTSEDPQRRQAMVQANAVDGRTGQVNGVKTAGTRNSMNGAQPPKASTK